MGFKTTPDDIRIVIYRLILSASSQHGLKEFESSLVLFVIIDARVDAHRKGDYVATILRFPLIYGPNLMDYSSLNPATKSSSKL
jgi:hypothetical protein